MPSGTTGIQGNLDFAGCIYRNPRFYLQLRGADNASELKLEKHWDDLVNALTYAVEDWVEAILEVANYPHANITYEFEKTRKNKDCYLHVDVAFKEDNISSSHAKIGGGIYLEITPIGLEFGHFSVNSFRHEFGHKMGLSDLYTGRGFPAPLPDQPKTSIMNTVHAGDLILNEEVDAMSSIFNHIKTGNPVECPDGYKEKTYQFTNQVDQKSFDEYHGENLFCIPNTNSCQLRLERTRKHGWPKPGVKSIDYQ